MQFRKTIPVTLVAILTLISAAKVYGQLSDPTSSSISDEHLVTKTGRIVRNNEACRYSCDGHGHCIIYKYVQTVGWVPDTGMSDEEIIRLYGHHTSGCPHTCSSGGGSSTSYSSETLVRDFSSEDINYINSIYDKYVLHKFWSDVNVHYQSQAEHDHMLVKNCYYDEQFFNHRNAIVDDRCQLYVDDSVDEKLQDGSYMSRALIDCEYKKFDTDYKRTPPEDRPRYCIPRVLNHKLIL